MPGPTTARGPARVVRAAVLGSTAVALATTAHVSGGGTLPGPLVLALVAVPVAWICVALARRTRGALAVGLALVGLQAALHETFMLQAGGMCGHVAATASVHAHHLTSLPGCAATPMAAAVVVPPVAMAGAHLVATLATAWLLVRADRLAASVAGLLGVVGGRLRPALVPWVAPDRPASVRPERAPRALRPAVLVRATPRRGPPARRSLPSPRPALHGLRYA